MDPVELYLSSKGRISRKTFWIGAGGLIIWGIAIFVVLWAILGASLIQNFLGRLVGFAFTLPTIYFAYNLAAKRFNDRDRPIICAQAGAALAVIKSITDLVRITGNANAQTILDQLLLLAGTGVCSLVFHRARPDAWHDRSERARRRSRRATLNSQRR